MIKIINIAIITLLLVCGSYSLTGTPCGGITESTPGDKADEGSIGTVD